MSEKKDKPKAKFQDLSPAARARFLRLNLGFLSDVAAALGVARSTTGKTWRGERPRPNPAVVDALEAAYQAIQVRDAKRRSRLKLNPRLARPAA